MKIMWVYLIVDWLCWLAILINYFPSLLFAWYYSIINRHYYIGLLSVIKLVALKYCYNLGVIYCSQLKVEHLLGVIPNKLLQRGTATMLFLPCRRYAVDHVAAMVVLQHAQHATTSIVRIVEVISQNAHHATTNIVRIVGVISQNAHHATTCIVWITSQNVHHAKIAIAVSTCLLVGYVAISTVSKILNLNILSIAMEDQMMLTQTLLFI